MFLAQFLGLRLVLDTLGRGLDYLWIDDFMRDGETRVSDIARVAAALGGPRFVWSLAVSAVCLAFVALGLWLAWRHGAPRPARRTGSTAP